MGPGYAPLFTGNLAGTYQTTLPGVLSTFTYALPDAVVLGDHQSGAAARWTWTVTSSPTGMIRSSSTSSSIPDVIQPDPLVCQPPTTANSLKVFNGTTDVTATHAVCYNPNSDTEYWGASITVTAPAGVLDNERDVPRGRHRRGSAGQHGERRRHRDHGPDLVGLGVTTALRK